MSKKNKPSNKFIYIVLGVIFVLILSFVSIKIAKNSPESNVPIAFFGQEERYIEDINVLREAISSFEKLTEYTNIEKMESNLDLVDNHEDIENFEKCILNYIYINNNALKGVDIKKEDKDKIIKEITTKSEITKNELFFIE